MLEALWFHFMIPERYREGLFERTVVSEFSISAPRRTQGMHKGAAALLWGEPAHDARQRFVLAAQRVRRRGGNPPAPAFPRRGKRERGRSNSLLPQATSYAAACANWSVRFWMLRLPSSKIPNG